MYSEQQWKAIQACLPRRLDDAPLQRVRAKLDAVANSYLEKFTNSLCQPSSRARERRKLRDWAKIDKRVVELKQLFRTRLEEDLVSSGYLKYLSTA
jgi:hypothetical protein